MMTRGTMDHVPIDHLPDTADATRADATTRTATIVGLAFGDRKPWIAGAHEHSTIK
jgi:hypothetical protein